MGVYIHIAQKQWELFEYGFKFTYPWASRASVTRRTLITMLALLRKIRIQSLKKCNGTDLYLHGSRGSYSQCVYLGSEKENLGPMAFISGAGV